MSASARPLTQQGLTGLKPSTAGGQRIYKDKRYYLAQLQSKNSAIREELVRLKKRTEENKMKTLNLEDLRKKAREAAKTIEEEQELLTAYNVALEMHISKTKEQEVMAEIENLKRENEIKMKELDALFNRKVKLQDQISKVEKERTEREKALKEMIDGLPHDQKEEYYKLKSEHEAILKEIQEVQDEINNDKEEIDKYEAIISESPELQEKFQLLQTIQKLESQKDDLTAFLTNTQTPEQQREALLQQVKADKADIETLQKLSETLEEETAHMEEKIAEIDKELDSKDNARLKKHRELREREAHMDTFIEGYEEKVTAAKQKVVQINDRMVSYLEQMTENLAELNLEEFGKVQFDPTDQSLESWNKRVTALTEQKEMLLKYKVRFEEEIDRLKTKKMDMLMEMERMSDIEKCKQELSKEMELLEEENQSLQSKYESTHSAVDEVTRKKTEVTRKLEDNPRYHKVMEIEKSIEELENKKAEIETALEADKNDSSLEEIVSHVRDLMNQRNEQLIAGLKSKSNK